MADYELHSYAEMTFLDGGMGFNNLSKLAYDQWFHQSSNGSVQTGTVQSSPGPVQEIFWTGIGPIPDADRLDWAWTGPIPHGAQG